MTLRALAATSVSLRKKRTRALQPVVAVASALHAEVGKPEVACARVAERRRPLQEAKLVVRHWT